MNAYGTGNPPGPPQQRYSHHLSSTGNQVRRSDYPTGPRQDQPGKAGWPGTTPDTQEDTPQQSQEVVIHTPTHQQAPFATQKICDAQMHQEHAAALQTLHTILAQHTTNLDNRDSQSVWDQSRATTVALDPGPDCSPDVHGRSRRTDFGSPGEAQISLGTLGDSTLQETPQEIVVQHQGLGELSSPDAVCKCFLETFRQVDGPEHRETFDWLREIPGSIRQDRCS